MEEGEKEMTATEVNLHFEKALEAPFNWSMNGFTITFFAFGIIVFIIGLLFYWADEERVKADLGLLVPGLLIIAATSFVYFIVGGNQQADQVKKNIAKWKQDYAIPYINALPPEKRKIVFVKIEATSTPELKDHGGWLRTEEVHRTPLTVSYKDNGQVITKTDWYNANMGLIAEDEPYMEYVNLPEPLGVTNDGKSAEFWAGQYNYQVYLPMNYKFTDIK